METRKFLLPGFRKWKVFCIIFILLIKFIFPLWCYQSLNYEPGDHVGVCPMNRVELVNGIIEKLTGVTNPDEDLQLQVLNEKHTSNGNRIVSMFPCLEFQTCSLI